MSRAKEYFDRANAHYNAKQLLKAKECLLKAHEILPNHAQISEFLGFILMLLKEHTLARFHYENAIKCSQNSPSLALLNNYSKLMLDLGDFQGSVERCRYIVERDPEFAAAWKTLGDCYRYQQKTSGAAQCYEKAYKYLPDDYALIRNLSHCYHSLCLWNKAEKLDNRLVEISEIKFKNNEPAPLSTHVAMTFVTDGMLMKKIAANQAMAYQKIQKEIGLSLPAKKHKRKKGRLRVGYLSGCFSRHATAYLLQDLFCNHDREKIEIFAYAVSPDHACGFYKKIHQTVEHIQEFHSDSDLEIAKSVQDNELDILVDLDGLVGHSRRGVFSLRPAPIQITWLGTPGTSGAPWIDYILSDDTVSPAEFEDHYSEKILRMPDSYFFNSFRSMNVERTSKSDYGLPGDKFIFASFNLNRKLDQDTFLAWCEILRAVEDSVLWIMIDDDETFKNLTAVLEGQGIEAERLISAGRVSNEKHLERLCHADLMLDSFICGAHTTCVEALWVGLPVITKIGEVFHGRVAASILNAAGMEDCITHSREDFISRAIEIAQNPEKLTDLKQHLHNNKKQLPVFDQKKWVKNWEKILSSVAGR